MAKGWRKEPIRHGLASRGIKTANKNKPITRAMQYKDKEISSLSRQRDNYEKYILASIDNEGYENKELKTPKEKLQFLQNTFKDEYGFAISRQGEQKARAEWLSGLPSSISLPFYNDDIINFSKKMGSLRQNSTEKEESRVLENYWNYMSNQISRLNTKYGVR